MDLKNKTFLQGAIRLVEVRYVWAQYVMNIEKRVCLDFTEFFIIYYI
jgi:hypothetical protein